MNPSQVTRRVGNAAFLLGTLAVLGGCGDNVQRVFHDLPGYRAVRPTTPNGGNLVEFEPGDTVETFDSPGGRFKIHFTRAGRHAVPLADANTNNVPDHVESLADQYDEVHTFYHDTLGYQEPPTDENVASGNGGDARFDVYLLDFARSSDGQFVAEACTNAGRCTGFMVQENDFAGYSYPSAAVGNRVLASHEYFHAVQAAYVTGASSVLGEGTAVWATERYDGTMDDFEAFLDGFLQNPDRSLDKPLPGPVDPFSYGSAIFFRFLEERYEDTVIRRIWESMVPGANGIAQPTMMEALDATLTLQYQSSLAQAYLDFATWNLMMGARSDPSRSYVNGRDYPAPTMELVVPPVQETNLRHFYASTLYRVVPVEGRTSMTARVVASPGLDPSLDGLELLLATRTRTSVGPIQHVTATAVPTPLTTTSVTEIVVALVNTNSSGNSKRPSLCIGSPEEVDACVAAVSAGGVDAGVPPADAGSGGDTPPTDPPGPCWCAKVTSSFGGTWLVLLGLALVRARRRR